MERHAITHVSGAPRGRLFRGMAAACALTVLSACAANPATTASKPRAIRHIALALGQTTVGGTPHAQPMPVYPVALLSLHLPPRTLEARLTVDAQGEVASVQVRSGDGADAMQGLFAEAVRQAALAWTFEPLRVQRWAADAAGDTHAVDDAAQPFMVDYVFSFAWQDGRPRVTALAVGRAP